MIVRALTLLAGLACIVTAAFLTHLTLGLFTVGVALTLAGALVTYSE